MEGKASDWRPGPTVCRCCLTEGCYKDISTEYFWMGKREVYSEMLKETLDVSIGFSKSGGPNSNSRLICEPCISRLRDASEFKRQVMDCEKTFMHHLDPGTSSSSSSKAQELAVDTIGEVKMELVKHEKESLSDDDFDDRPDFLDVDSDDDLDDQPLTKLATKIPKKESVSLLDLLDTSQITVKRKSTLKLKTPPKKIVKKKEVVKPSASKAAPVKQTEKKKELKHPIVAKRNAELIVKHSTVYPFKLPENYIVCVYCCESFEQSSTFRKHMDLEHKTFSIRVAFAHCAEGFLKADCSDIRCRICLESTESLEEIANHLQEKHNFMSKLDLTAPLGIQPFNFKQDKLSCAICKIKSCSLRQLSRHTQSHFLMFNCESCSKTFSTNSVLQEHIKYSHTTNRKHFCRRCQIQFSSADENNVHLQENVQCRKYMCNLCSDRFISYVSKQNHMREVHGVVKYHACPECEKKFKDKKAFFNHFKVTHTDDNIVCTICGLKFATQIRYERHKILHTNEKPNQCTICGKAYTKKHSLNQHMWSHKEEKRFECNLCSKKFNHKVSLKSHMQTNHSELR